MCIVDVASNGWGCTLPVEERQEVYGASYIEPDSDSELFLSGEFDPGSGQTLAACFRHASRTGVQAFGLGR